MQSTGLRSLYYNSGAFGFADDVATTRLGWIGLPDETIRPAMRALTRLVESPVEENLSRLFIRAWREVLSENIWIMPASHWAFELDFGSADWMPAELTKLGIDSKTLQPLTNAAAIEFSLNEADAAEQFIRELLMKLRSSDFYIAFPGRRAVCMLHHHKQIWWISADDRISRGLNAIITAPV